MPLFEILYGFLAAWLALYGFNSLLLTALYLWKRNHLPETPRWNKPWPVVTVQLPIRNELHVVERLIAAVSNLDYPREALQIQVLDDSTDETQAVARQLVSRYARVGVDIQYLHRTHRTGFKAGALARGLERARGEWIAVFDADFVPPRDFLRRLVPHFVAPDVGCVQARWDHLNRCYSPLTRAQALGVDAHFVVEQRARSQAGLFLNFNGSAGLWRRACIEDAGGWQHDTVTEDLDLSYRAQLAGWRILYRPDVLAPGELPPQFDALRRQQARWAQGSIQVARKLLPQLLRSEQPWWVRVEGAIHLTGYMVHPLLVATLLLTLPVLQGTGSISLLLPYVLLATIGPPLMSVVAQSEHGSRWWRELRFLPLLMLIGMGLALSNTIAMLRGLLVREIVFQRTPKFAVREGTASWQQSTYALRGSSLIWPELLLAALSSMLAVSAFRQTTSSLGCWLAIYALGYSCVAGLSLVQAAQAWQAQIVKEPAGSWLQLVLSWRGAVRGEEGD